MTPGDQPSVLRPALVYVVLFTAVGAFFPYASVFFRETGLSLELVGALAALNAAAAVVAAPIWGAAADRLGDVRGPIVVAGLWSAAAAGLLSVAREPLALAVGIVLVAAGSAGIGPMLDSRTIELVGPDRDRFGRARAWGSAAFIASSLGVGLLLEGTGAAGLFLVFIPALALTSLVAYLLLFDGPGRGSAARRTRPAGFWTGLGGIVREPTLLAFFGGSVLLWASVSAVTTFVSIHLVELGTPTGLVGLVWTPGALVEVPLMLAFPAIVRRVGAERLIVLGGLAFAARAAGWALASEPLAYVAIAPLGGIGFGLFYTGTVTYVSRAVPREVQATAQGIYTGTAFSLGTIVGSIGGGVLATALTIPGLFGVSAVAAVAAALIVRQSIEARKTAPVP